MREAQKMMNDPAFQAQMKKVTESQQFKQHIQAQQEMLCEIRNKILTLPSQGRRLTHTYTRVHLCRAHSLHGKGTLLFIFDFLLEKCSRQNSNQSGRQGGP